MVAEDNLIEQTDGDNSNQMHDRVPTHINGNLCAFLINKAFLKFVVITSL
jgi:hypothetical protein